MSSASSGSAQKEEPKKPPTPEKAPEKEKGAVREDNKNAADALKSEVPKKPEAPVTSSPPEQPAAPKTEKPAGDQPSPSPRPNTSTPDTSTPTAEQGKKETAQKDIPSYAKKTSDVERGRQFNDTVTRLGQKDPAIQKAHEKYEAEKKAFDTASKNYQSSNAFLNAFKSNNASDKLYRSQQSLDTSRADLLDIAGKNPNISPEDMRALRGASFSENTGLQSRNADAAAQLSDTYRTYENGARMIRNTAGGVALGTAAVMTGGLALEGAALATGGTLTTAGTLGAYVGGVAAAGTTGALAGYGYELLRGSAEIGGTAAITGKFSETTEKLAPIAEAKARESAETGAKIGAAIGAVGPLSSTITTGIGVGLASYGAAQGVDTIKQNVGRSQELSREAGKAFIHGDDASAARLREEASLANLQAALGGVDIAASVGVGGAVLKKITTPRQNTPAPHTVTVDMGDGNHVTPIDISTGHAEIPPPGVHTPEQIRKPDAPIRPHIEQTERLGVEPPLQLSEKSEQGLRPIPLTRNTQLRDIRDVPRDTVIHQIGDTNGSYEGFQANLKAGERPLIDGQGNWIGGDRKLIMMGDILGDRNMGSLQTYEHIARLRAQGADIHVLAGNHEDLVIGHLTDGQHNGYSAAELASLNDQGKGLLEFAKFVDPNIRNFDTIPSGDTILSAMRKDPRGRTILEQMTQLKLGVHADDTLNVHTDPNHKMIAAILRDENGIDGLNALFQKNLNARLLDGADPATLDPEFYALRNDFLSIKNGRAGHERTGKNIVPMSEADGMALRNFGINRITHGHTDHGALATTRIGGVEITSIDNSTFKGGVDNGRRSAYTIDTEGNHLKGLKGVDPLPKSSKTSEQDIPKDAQHLPPPSEKKDGPYVDKTEYSVTHKGTLLNGKKEGIQISENNGKYFGFRTYKEGVINGPSEFRYPDGTIMQRGAYKDNKEHGPREFREFDGSIRRREYVDGIIKGKETYTYPNGQEQGFYTYKDNIRNGDSEWRYSDGALMKKGRYTNGEKDGLWEEHEPANGRHETGVYAHDRRHGLWKITEGKQTSTVQYEKGEVVGEWKHTDKDGNASTESYAPDGELIYQ